MSAPSPPQHQQDVPWLQRLFENIWFLLILGLLVPTVFYTFWSVIDLLILPRFGDDSPHGSAPPAQFETLTSEQPRIGLDQSVAAARIVPDRFSEEHA